MTYHRRMNRTVALLLTATLTMLPMLATAQTRVSLPKNKYKVQDDVKIGRDAAKQVEQQMPILNDAQALQYVERVGKGWSALSRRSFSSRRSITRSRSSTPAISMRLHYPAGRCTSTAA